MLDQQTGFISGNLVGTVELEAVQTTFNDPTGTRLSKVSGLLMHTFA